MTLDRASAKEVGTQKYQRPTSQGTSMNEDISATLNVDEKNENTRAFSNN